MINKSVTSEDAPEPAPRRRRKRRRKAEGGAPAPAQSRDSGLGTAWIVWGPDRAPPPGENGRGFAQAHRGRGRGAGAGGPEGVKRPPDAARKRFCFLTWSRSSEITL